MSHFDDGQLHAWLDGETTGNDAERIDRHLAQCDECTARLDAVARVHARAGELVAGVRSADAPAWADLVARAQAPRATAPPAAEREPAVDHSASPSTPPRGLWTPRLLTSGLAWAATLVLAFGLGWYAGLRPDAALRSNTEFRSELATPAAKKDLDVVQQESPVGDEDGEGLVALGQAQQPAVQEESLVQKTAADHLAATEPEGSTTVAGERNEFAENRAEAVAEPPAAVADGRLDRREYEPVEQAQRRAAPERERQMAVEAEEAAGVPMGDAVASSPESDSDSNAPLDIVGWLGREPLRLEGAVLASATVAPLAAGPGNPSEPGIWLLFDDPQTGTRVTVAQRSWRQVGRVDEADDAPLPTGVEAAMLTVIPDGSRQLWWVTADGYLVLVTADVDEATLRDLAQRLH
jgi:anti-sigma factor RsiW